MEVHRPVDGLGHTAVEAVVRLLRGAIHRGVYVPGSHLPPERELAGQLGVARLTLREAIHRLHEAGYVDSRRGAGGGTFVLNLDVPRRRWALWVNENTAEFKDRFETRIALEQRTCQLAARRGAPADLEVVRAAAVATTNLERFDDYLAADSQFHVCIAQAAASPTLLDGVVAARSEIFWFPQDEVEEPPTEPFWQQHIGIADFITRGLAREAAEQMEEHLIAVRDLYVNLAAEITDISD